MRKIRVVGNISALFLNLKHLSDLDLSYNDFGGIPIPSSIDSLVSLTYLNLSEAGFDGLIPCQLGNLTRLRHLRVRGPYVDLDDKSELMSAILIGFLNNLDSPLPNWLFTLNGLVSLTLQNYNFGGPIPIGLKNLTALRNLVLGEIDFTSKIMPQWLYGFQL
ncbi:receptor-like protein 53 [Hevea brasiliensis]|uniref:receptor-like protein 53 n=1 Tax=Hevea brasiliensis TaxID=3981 RepID=UPI0025FB58B6|nr:receptor-like protein 53 [Hevea brasiliensis]